MTPDQASALQVMAEAARPDEYLILGWTHANELGEIVLDRWHMPEQTVSPGFCEVTKAGRIALTNLEPDDPAESLRLYSSINAIIHSHVGGGTSLSGIDDKWMNEILSKNMDYFVSLVIGSHGTKISGEVHMMKPFRAGLKANVGVIVPEEFRARYTQLVKDNVSKRVLPPSMQKGVDNKFNKNYNHSTFKVVTGISTFSIENPLFDSAGNALCCGNPMAIMGTTSHETKVYCRFCYNDVHIPVKLWNQWLQAEFQ